MKKLLSFVCAVVLMLLLSVADIFAATPEYRQAVIDLIEVSGDESFSFQQMESSLSSVMGKKRPDLSAGDVLSLMQKYQQEQFKTDLYDVVVPYYEANLTHDELKQLIAAYTSNEGREAVIHTRMLNDPLQMQQLVAAMLPQLQNIMQGNDVAISKPIDCPVDYRNSFEKYCNNSGFPTLIDNMFQSISVSLMAQIADENQRSLFSKAMMGFGDYMKRELPIAMLNLSYGKITKNDLDFYNRLLVSPEGKKCSKVALDMTSDIVNVGQNIVGRFEKWIDAQGK